MRKLDIIRAWGRIVVGRTPAMSIEITRRCPLSCTGCYAYQDSHLSGAGSLANIQELEGEQLVSGVLSLVDLHKPLHLSIVGGEPLIRRREITLLLPELERRRVHTQIVTSAVAPIPVEWRNTRNLSIVVSVDGLPTEHDRRRAPATYERILSHIYGHAVTVHCTVTRQMTHRPGYLAKFFRFWSKQWNVHKIWVSLYTPQIGESTDEMLSPEIRSQVIDELLLLRNQFPKLELPSSLLQAYKNPPSKPSRCVFALTTRTVSADLRTMVKPCQLGGSPDCHQCGCVAAAGLEAVSRHRLPIGIRTGTIFALSRALGLQLTKLRSVASVLSQPNPEAHPIPHVRGNSAVRTDGA